MFKPNRVGSPLIHMSSNASTSSNATLGNDDPTTTTFRANNINTTPQADFGEDHLYYTGTSAVTNGRRFMIGQQFTVSTPLSGPASVRGVELRGGWTAKVPHGLQVVPFITKMASAAASNMALTAVAFPTLFRAWQQPLASDTLVYKHFSYKEDVILKYTDVAGTYMHGFMAYDNAAAGWNLTMFHMMCSVRQLNDQQGVGYADTLR